MNNFNEYLEQLNEAQYQQMKKILDWVQKEYPTLEPVIKWNQPMFQTHGTFIIGFSVSKKHISVAPENVVMEHFQQAIERAGYSQSKALFRILLTDEVNFKLLREIIDYNIEEKQEMTTFWRK